MSLRLVSPVSLSHTDENHAAATAQGAHVVEPIRALYLGDQNFLVSPGFINMTRGSFPKTARKSTSVDELGKAP